MQGCCLRGLRPRPSTRTLAAVPLTWMLHLGNCCWQQALQQRFWHLHAVSRQLCTQQSGWGSSFTDPNVEHILDNLPAWVLIATNHVQDHGAGCGRILQTWTTPGRASYLLWKGRPHLLQGSLGSLGALVLAVPP